MNENPAATIDNVLNRCAVVSEALQTELAAARRDGVVSSANLPFLLTPQCPPRAGILLVHGFSASPREMRGFAERLAAAGYLALGVRLPGHGTTPADLRTRRYEEWLEAVADGERLLAQRTSRVYGVGLSTGAMLLLALAARRPLAGLVLLSPFLRLRHPLAPAAGLLRHLRPYQQRPIAEELAPYYYALRPLAGVHQLMRLVRRVRSELPGLEPPTLAISAEGDQTARVDSAIEMFRRLGSRHKEFHLFGPDVPHVLTTEENPRREETLELILRFLQGIEECYGRDRADGDTVP